MIMGVNQNNTNPGIFQYFHNGIKQTKEDPKP